MGTKRLAVALGVALALPALAQEETPASLAAPALAAGGGLGQAAPLADEGRRNPMATVATNALYGGAAGAVVGVGAALIEGDHWARDVTVGAGLGVLVGAAVGGYMAYGDQGGARVARDGLGTPARDRGLRPRMTTVAAYALRF